MTVTQALKRSAHATLLCALVALALVGHARPAAAATPCWKLLITDWYDGTIDKTYPIPCYQQAINHLPTDAKLYSNAKDDILRAMGRAIALQNASKHSTTTTAAPTTTSSKPSSGGTDTTTTGGSGGGGGGGGGGSNSGGSVAPVTTTDTTPSPGREKPKGIARALDKLNPGDADSFPLPLLILGLLAILLVAAGIAGMIWRRMDADDTDTGAGPA